MSNAIYHIDPPVNEPLLTYAPGTFERKAIAAQLKSLRAHPIEIPLIIGGKEITTESKKSCVIPHEHGKVLATYSEAGAREIQMAIDASKKASQEWSRMPWADRLAIFKRAGELIAGPYRMLINAATMLGQSKNLFQAEIDAAAELIDFLRFNTYFATQIFNEQPISERGIWNQLEYRPLEGFIFAISPFNFTSIAANLVTAPAMLGNTVLWKPASTAVYSGYHLMKIFKEAGVPDGVINFVPCPGRVAGPMVLKDPDLAGVHFTGSTKVFQDIWKTVGENIANYKTYPRLVGETGGKDFVFAHPSADMNEVATALIRGSFEFQGQKCSASSRAYIPESMWPELNKTLVDEVSTITVGSPEDFTQYVNAVIDKPAFDSIVSYIEYAKNAPDAEIICGGTYDDSKGYFINPTIIVAKKPDFKTMAEEIFGPVLTIYVYEDAKFEETLRICDETSPYALTGAVFSRDRQAIVTAKDILVHAAGNFYINDKPTGAVVGQQPFGGGRASGTNDKAGSPLNLNRWLSPRTIKENFISPKSYPYPFLEKE